MILNTSKLISFLNREMYNQKLFFFFGFHFINYPVSEPQTSCSSHKHFYSQKLQKKTKFYINKVKKTFSEPCVTSTLEDSFEMRV